MKLKSLAGLMLALMLGSGLGWLARQHGPERPEQIVPASAALAVQQLLAASLSDLEGRPQALAQWRGRPLLINVWTSWCAPCREEMPEFDALAREKRLPELQVLGLAWDSAENVRAFLQQQIVGYPVLLLSENVPKMLAALGNPAGGLPFTLYIDAAGRPQAIRLGAFRQGELGRWVRKHTEENGGDLR